MRLELLIYYDYSGQVDILLFQKHSIILLTSACHNMRLQNVVMDRNTTIKRIAIHDGKIKYIVNGRTRNIRSNSNIKLKG